MDRIDNKIVSNENQYKVVEELFNNFENDLVINQLVLGKTQSGKTNIIRLFIEELVNKQLYNNYNRIEKIYVLTGYSSIDWLKQMRERLGDIIGVENIYHQNNLRNKKIITQFNSSENYIVFIDENHIACRKNYKKGKRTEMSESTPTMDNKSNLQTITRLFEECCWNDIKYCIEKNIKIIQISATPDGTLYDLEDWGEHSKIIFYEPPLNYIGSYDLYKQGRIRQYKDLYENDIELQNKYIDDIIETIQSFKEPRYHIIRLKTGIKFKKMFNLFIDKLTLLTYEKDSGRIKLCTFLFEDMEFGNRNGIESNDKSDIDINELFLKRKPEFHLILFIKEKLRCAKTIYKKYLGLCYERISTMDSVIIQGLVGRMNGYYNEEDTNNDSICYTNIETILKYEELWNSRWCKKDIEWNSNSTKFMYNTTISKGTYTYNPLNVLNPKESKLISSIHKSDIIQFKEFNIFEEAKKYIKNILQKTSPHNPMNKIKNINENGFIETIIYKKKVYSVEEIKSYEPKAIMNKNNGFRLYPCYYDINNKDTLIFMVCHY